MEKIFYVDSKCEGYQKIKKEMGENALILSFEEILKNGDENNKSDCFSSKKYKVTAYIDDGKENLKEVENNSFSINEDGLKIQSLEKQVNDLKKYVDLLAKNQINNEFEVNETNPIDNIIEKFYAKFLDNDIKPDIALLIKQRLDIANPDNSTKLALSELFELSELSCDDKIHFFIGNPGSGKTTSIIKLSTTFSIGLKKKILIITTDCYKESGYDQIFEQCDFLGIHSMKAQNSKELINLISKNFNNYDLIFIDTPGVDKDYKALNNIFPENMSYKTTLVLNANSRYREQVKKISFFNEIGFDFIVFTKLDETFSYGNIINIMHDNSQKKLICLTNGQDTAKNIIINKEKCVELLMQGIA
ncbi:MAG: hypothetical protein M0R46_01175 [Candidatus Muirbacterium halophilum]|nr:hypothetical protein [Candidatus Muirbacterium halophilum]MCK9474507.1 hypothetical protein [Candidatus Muirbacterium halophilum]